VASAKCLGVASISRDATCYVQISRRDQVVKSSFENPLLSAITILIKLSEFIRVLRNQYSDAIRMDNVYTHTHTHTRVICLWTNSPNFLLYSSAQLKSQYRDTNDWGGLFSFFLSFFFFLQNKQTAHHSCRLMKQHSRGEGGGASGRKKKKEKRKKKK